jgi:DNA-binding NtrC family response regulator
MRSEATVLFVSGHKAETIVFERILGEHMVLKKVQDLAELHAALGKGNHYDPVLCGGSFRKGEWKDALRHVLQGNPDFPLIISRRIGTEREWVEVLGAGAFDLLNTRDGRDPVLSALEDAVATYEARHLKDVWQWRLSPKQVGQEKSGATIASRQLRRGTRRISPIRHVPDTRIGISPS